MRKHCLCLLALGWTLACTSTAPAPPVAPIPALPAVDLPLYQDEKALLLLLIDQQLYEPFAVTRFLESDPPLRKALTVALGRIGSPRARPALEILVRDPVAEIRQEAAFALGLLGQWESIASLLYAARDGDSDTGRLAVEALAKLEAPLLEVVEALAGLPEEERWSRLLPSLFRFQDAGAVVLARQARLLENPAYRRWGLYAVARDARPEALKLLREGLSDEDPWVRGWAVRALGSVGEAGDASAISALLSDSSAGVVTQALRALAKMVGDGRRVPGDDERSRVVELLEHGSAGVRVTALSTASVWLRDEVLSAKLGQIVHEDEGYLGDQALLALARGGEPVAFDLVTEALQSPSPARRQTAAIAAQELEAWDLVERLDGDPAARVRVAVLTAMIAQEDGALGAALNALLDSDPAVRATALGYFEENPNAPAETLAGALTLARRDRIPDARLAAVAALRARADHEPLERGGIIVRLEELDGSDDYQVRRAASEALEALGRPGLQVGKVDTGKNLELYRDIVFQTGQKRRFEMTTVRGRIVLELDCPTAPLTCLNFAQLAGHGYFDGLVFHRVVPDFVIQTGDPRGDGWGGPGYAIRDEINRIRYEAGTLGMALSGPDTGGSQFFITQSLQPHLDGGYTAFGKVLEGMHVVNEIVQGDRIESVRELGRDW